MINEVPSISLPGLLLGMMVGGFLGCPAVAAGPPIPSNAIADTHRELLTNWKWQHDAGAQGGPTTGSSAIVSTPQRDGQSRQYIMSYQNNGAERFSVTWPTDPDATHFVYENWIWLESVTSIANLELDTYQTLANGRTMIYAFQCSGYSNAWEYSANVGTVDIGKDQWFASAIPCTPKQWTPQTWIHVQIAFSRDAVGNITYESVYVDGVGGTLKNATVFGAYALNWSPVMLTNFQIDGLGASGSATAYSDGMTIYRWVAVPVVNSASASAIMNQPFQYQITGTENPTRYAASGLPAGLTIDAKTGLISGTPTVAGTFDITVEATNLSGTGTATLHLNLTNPDSNAPVVSDLANVRVYPNPWRADQTASSPITFDRLGSDSEIRIFTVSGHLVKKLPMASGTATWDRTNDSGQTVTSGIYLYSIKTPSDQSRGKLAIIR